MPVLLFVGADGVESRHRLVPFTSVRLGRDPGNEIVLRDPKVSRQHAEIIFEKGFFVVRDLSSANGTFINGRKIRVAPLTDGAELRLGGSIGRFSEEVEDQQPTVVAAVEPSENSEDHEKQRDYSTTPHPLANQDAPASEDERSKSERSAAGDLQLQSAVLAPVENSDLVAIRHEDGAPMYWLRRPSRLPRSIAAYLASIMIVTGATASIALMMTSQWVPALATVFLTFTFMATVLLLVPRRTLSLCSDEALRNRVITIQEAAGLGFPRLEFALVGSDRGRIGTLIRPAVAAGAVSWTILDAASRRIGSAREPSGPFRLRLTRPYFEFAFGSRVAARLDRRSTPPRLVTLADAPAIDPRIVYGAAATIDATER